ncbi:MAG: type I methionyl aminopeptidase [Desulfobacterales bacterium]|nr:type I methionyl aminopeptidase [Desulfobacterales bacterium]
MIKNKIPKIGRNESCPCGSGHKYKKCCQGKLDIPLSFWEKVYTDQHKIRLKNSKDIEGIKETGKLVLKTLDLVEESIKPGITTNDINTLVHEFTIKNGAIPAPLNYRGFPKSVCTSVNSVICHGIPNNYVLKEGDIVNVDITTILNGYYADANKTFFVGTPSPQAKKIVEVSKQALKQGIAMVKSGNTIGDIGWAIQKYATNNNCSVVQEYVGHGIGFEFHEQPIVPHYGKRGDGFILIPGMVFTIEPMLNLGGKELQLLSDKWTVVTKDGSLSAQFEQTILVTSDGYESLTPYEII